MRQLTRRSSDHSMSFPTKALSLNSHLPMVRKLAKSAATPVGSKNESAPQLGEQLPRQRFLEIHFPLLMSFMCVSLVTASLLLLDQSVAANLTPIAYLIPVIVAATQWGIWPATLAAIAGMAAADFFFFPPLYSLVVADPSEVIDLLVFLVVALVSSNLASRLRRETDTLRQREKEIQQLYEFSRLLAACFTVSDLISAIQNYLSRTLGQQTVFLAATADGHFASPEPGSLPKVVQERVASMSATVEIPSQTFVDEPKQNIWLLKAVKSKTAVHGVVAVNMGSGSRQVVDIRTRRVEAILEEVSLTLQRLDIEKAMKEARLHLQSQLLRDAFHGTLSHELCSPLAAIQGSASVLESMPLVQNDDLIRSLVEGISDEVTQLEGFIQNLLSATQVTAGGLRPRFEWADPRDIVNAAVKRRTRRLAAHSVRVEFADDLPLINVDSRLIEDACGQLLENAAKYSPSGSTIATVTRADQDRVIISISDQGVGIAPDERQHIGLRAFRSQHHQATVPGSGLGFWIASTFVGAHGGTVEISSPGLGQGATASITLPCSAPQASDRTD